MGKENEEVKLVDESHNEKYHGILNSRNIELEDKYKRSRIRPCIGPSQSLENNENNGCKRLKLQQYTALSKTEVSASLSDIGHNLIKLGSLSSTDRNGCSNAASAAPLKVLVHDIFPTLKDTELSLKDVSKISSLSAMRLQLLAFSSSKKLRWSGPDYTNLRNNMNKFTTQLHMWHATAQRDKLHRPPAICSTKEGRRNFLNWKQQREGSVLDDCSSEPLQKQLSSTTEVQASSSLEDDAFQQFADSAEKLHSLFIAKVDSNIAVPSMEIGCKRVTRQTVMELKKLELPCVGTSSPANDNLPIEIPVDMFYGQNKMAANLAATQDAKNSEMKHEKSESSQMTSECCLLCNKLIDKALLERHMNDCLDEQESAELLNSSTIESGSVDASTDVHNVASYVAKTLNRCRPPAALQLPRNPTTRAITLIEDDNEDFWVNTKRSRKK